MLSPWWICGASINCTPAWLRYWAAKQTAHKSVRGPTYLPARLVQGNTNLKEGTPLQKHWVSSGQLPCPHVPVPVQSKVSKRLLILTSLPTSPGPRRSWNVSGLFCVLCYCCCRGCSSKGERPVPNLGHKQPCHSRTNSHGL